MNEVSWGVLILMAVAWFVHVLVMRKVQEKRAQQIAWLNKKQENLEMLLTMQSYHLDDMLAAIHDPVLRLDRQGKVLSANTKAEHLFAIKKFTGLPQPMVALYRKPDWLELFHQALLGLPKAVELPEIFIEGQVFLPRLTALNGSEALMFFANITTRYHLELQRKDFVANLMHDLKTPLTSLLGYARSIELFVDDKLLREEAVNVICQEASHVSALLDALLSVEQIEHSTVAVGVSCDVVAVCRQVWQSLQFAMQDKDVTLELNLPETVVLVAMQEADCYRVICNVASNAVRYTEQNSEITCVLSEAGLYIEDEGEGIPEQDLSHVTERFYRVDKSRARGGHGLGLAIVKETLQRDGGSIELSNAEHGGLLALLKFPMP